MRILVTGATGRVGSVVARRLIERGDEVRALALEDDPALARLDGLGVSTVFGDLATGAGLQEACSGLDAAIHLGALMAWTQDDWPRLFDINIRGTFNLLQAIAARSPGIKRVVLASTDASYPASNPLYAPVDESHPQLPSTFYGMTKQVDEVLGQFYMRKLGLPIARARFCYTLHPAEILDPDNAHSGHMFFLATRLAKWRVRTPRTPKVEKTVQVLEGLQPDDGSQRILVPYGENGESWVYTLCHVEDLVAGILLLLEKDAAVGDVFNLGPAGPFAMDVALKYLSEVSGIPYVEAQLPGPPLVYTVDTSKARAVLGYSPQHDIFDVFDEAARSDS
jgi:UDP-glucose 4-epimerase